MNKLFSEALFTIPSFIPLFVTRKKGQNPYNSSRVYQELKLTCSVILFLMQGITPHNQKKNNLTEVKKKKN